MQRLKALKFPLYEILFTALGTLLGIFFNQFTLFELDTKISFGDLLIFVLTSFVGLYIAKNISRSLSRIQSIKSLYQDDIKAFVSYSNNLETWIENGRLPAADLRTHLRQGNMKLRFLKKLYGSNNQIDASSLDLIITKYNELKTDITSLGTVDNGAYISLAPAQIVQYQNQYEEVKCDLLNAIITS